MIEFYRKEYISHKGPFHCIYIPTCSQYGIEAIEKYGACKGPYFDNKKGIEMSSIR